MSATLWFLKPIVLTTEKKSRLEKAEIINATFTKNGDIIHTRHLENPQRRALPGKHTQEGQTEGQRSRKRSRKRREKRDRSKAKETESCSCRNLSLNILQPPILVFLFCPFNSSLSSLSALLCLQTSHYGNSFPGLTPPWIISGRTFGFQGMFFFEWKWCN